MTVLFQISVSQVIEFLLWGVKKTSILAKIEDTSSKLLYFVNRPGLQKVPKLYFQSQFSMSKTTDLFLKIFSFNNINLGDHFLF